MATGRGGLVRFLVPDEVRARLADLADRHGVSRFMVLHAAVATLLTRLGAGVDVPIGTTVPWSASGVAEPPVGSVENTLVLRTDTSGDPAFDELLGRVSDTDLAAFAHRELPFDRLVEALSPARSLACHPLFQVLLTVGERDGRNAAMPSPGSGDMVNVAVELVFELDETGGWGELRFAADVFDLATAEAIAARLVRVLAAVAADPKLRLSQVDLLAPEERRLIVGHWNDTALAVPSCTVPDLVQAQVRRTPGAVALAWPAGELAYAELNERANRLAHYLIGLGSRP